MNGVMDDKNIFLSVCANPRERIQDWRIQMHVQAGLWVSFRGPYWLLWRTEAWRGVYQPGRGQSQLVWYLQVQTGGGRGPVFLCHRHRPHQPGVPPAQASPQQIEENRNLTILCCDYADTRTATILIKTDNPVVYYVYFISDKVLYFCRNKALFWMNKIRTVVIPVL